MVILGIDPGLATLGYGILEVERGSQKMIQYGVLKTMPQQSLPVRLRAIYLGMTQLMEIYKPDDVAFEELFFAKNATTGMAVSAARGVALTAVVQKTENLYEYTPMQIKQAITGYGGADKHQMQHMVKLLLHMDDIARPDDAADALAVALTHANCLHAKEMFKIK